MFQLSPLTSEQRNNLQRVVNATALYLAVRPSAVVIRATPNLALVPAYSQDTVIQAKNSEFLPLIFPLIEGSINDAKHGYTVEVSDADGNTEILPCWGIHYTPYYHLFWLLPPSYANGQSVIVFDANFYPLLEATFKYYAESWFPSYVEAQGALSAITYVAPFDVTQLATIDNTHIFNRKTTEVNYQGGATALGINRDFDAYFSAPALADARIGYVFNDNPIGSPVKLHFTSNGAAPTITDGFIAPGDRLTLVGNTTINAFQFVALRPPDPTLNVTFDVGYRSTPQQTQTVDLNEGVISLLSDFFTVPDMESYSRLEITNNGTAEVGDKLYYTTDGTDPTLASKSVAPGETVLYRNLTIVRLTLVKVAFLSDLSADFMIVLRNKKIVQYYNGLMAINGSGDIDSYFSNYDITNADSGTVTNNNLIGAPAYLHYTTNGLTPTLADPAIAPGGTLTLANQANVAAFLFAALRHPALLVSATFAITYITPPNQSQTINLSESAIYSLSSYFPDNPHSQIDITNNDSTQSIYYTTNGTAPTLNSASVAPGQTVTLNLAVSLASIKVAFLTSLVLDFTISLNSLYAPTPINRAGFLDIEEGINVGQNSLNYAGISLVKVINERRVWQKFTTIITVLPTYPATGLFDARLRRAIFLNMTDETHCLIDATETPELEDPAFECLFPADITPPDAYTNVWIWKTNEPEPTPWLVVAIRAEGDIADDRGYYVPEGDEWYDDPKFGGTKIPIRDGLPYTTQNTTGSPPFVNLGSHQAVPLVNSQAIVTFPDAAGDNANSNSMAAYQWSCDGSSAVFDDATIQHPTLTLNGAGWYEVTLKVTDSYDNVGYGFRYIYVYDLSQPQPKFIGNPSFRSTGNGWSTSITLPATETANLRDNAFTLAWRRSWFNGVEDAPIGERVVFCGYITTGSIKINPDTSEVTFQAATLDEILKSIPVQAWAVQPVADFDGWEILPFIRLKRLFYYSLQWFSNALEVTDFHLDPLAVRLPDFATEASDLFTVGQQIATKFMANFAVDQAGRVFVYRDAQMLGDSARHALTVIAPIYYNLHLVNEIEFTKSPVNVTRQVRICGDAFSADTLVSVGAAVPYPIPSSSGGKIEKYDRVPVEGQAEAAVLAERFYALANLRIRELRAKFSADWSGVLSPAWRNWFTMTIPIEETGGLFSWNLQRIRVKSATYSYNSIDGILACEAVFEPEATTMFIAQTFTDCGAAIPPAQEKGGGGGLSVPPTPPTIDDQPTQLDKPPKVCPLKCEDAIPVNYAPNSCQFANVVVGELYIIGDTVYRDTTWSCNEASATVTEEWPIEDCQLVVHYNVEFSNQGDGFYGSGSAVLKAGQTITGSASESLSHEVSAGLTPETGTIELTGQYVYEVSYNIRRGTVTVFVTGLEVIPPA